MAKKEAFDDSSTWPRLCGVASELQHWVSSHPHSLVPFFLDMLGTYP